MKTIHNLFVFILIALFCLPLHAKTSGNNDSISLEIIMGSDMLKKINLDIDFISSLVVTQNGHILLSSSNQFYLLGWGGIKSVGQKVTDTIHAFAYTPDGYLMVTRNNELCYIDSIGNLAKLYEIPNRGMGLAAGKKDMYLFDQMKNQESYTIYVLTNEKKYYELITLSSPITAVIEANKNILFASENKLFSINQSNKEVKAIAVIPQIDTKIISITTDTVNNVVFFSSKNAVYALKDTTIVCITDKFGGKLLYGDNGLIVFAPEKKFLVRLPNEKETITEKKTASEALTNESIINMAKEKLSDDLIISIINKSNVNFTLDIDSMINLSNQNVSSVVIKAMKEAMKRKNKN